MNRHKIARFKATEGLHHPPNRAAHRQEYSDATLRVLSCLHSPELRCSCCNVVRFFCDLELCNLVTATAPELICVTTGDMTSSAGGAPAPVSLTGNKNNKIRRRTNFEHVVFLGYNAV
jgi:hypothetical protein